MKVTVQIGATKNVLDLDASVMKNAPGSLVTAAETLARNTALEYIDKRQTADDD